MNAQQGALDMRKVVAMSFYFSALLIAAGPAGAEAQQANIVLQESDHFGRHVSNARTSNDASSAYAQSRDIANWTCTYVGGPKSALWACR
jgi:hypothetical protein